MSLNERQQRFVEEYLIDLNATAAAQRAGYSAKTAYSIGGRLLNHVEIQEALQVGKAKRAARTSITKEYLVTKIADVFDHAVKIQSLQGVGRLGELLARLHGYIVENKNVRFIRSVTDLTDEELAAIAAGERNTEEETRH